MGTVRVAYLVGMYPALSLAFIAREIEAVRATGVEVVPFSIHEPPEHELQSEGDRATAKRTRNVQPPDLREVALAHTGALLRHPASYLRTLSLAMKISTPGLRNRLWHFFYFIEAIVLWRWMRQEGVKHIHAHFANSASMIALLYGAFARPQGGTWSFTMHGYTEFDDQPGYRLPDKVRRADLVVTISHFARSQLMKISPEATWDAIHIVHCGVDLERFKPPEVDPRTGNRVRILCVARMVPEKGVGMLIDAVAALVREGVAVELELIGAGPALEDLRARAAHSGAGDQITLLGPVGQDHIPDHYATADIFCLASFAEGIPVVLMEAMAFGRAVVAPRLMGIPELIDDGESGLLTVPGDLQSLTDTLRVAATDHPLRERLGVKARERVVAEYDITDSARELAELFGQTVRR